MVLTWDRYKNVSFRKADQELDKQLTIHTRYMYQH